MSYFLLDFPNHRQKDTAYHPFFSSFCCQISLLSAAVTPSLLPVILQWSNHCVLGIKIKPTVLLQVARIVVNVCNSSTFLALVLLIYGLLPFFYPSPFVLLHSLNDEFYFFVYIFSYSHNQTMPPLLLAIQSSRAGISLTTELYPNYFDFHFPVLFLSLCIFSHAKHVLFHIFLHTNFYDKDPLVQMLKSLRKKSI